jgi:DNA (cytosine-5)-methyltransferase 1
MTSTADRERAFGGFGGVGGWDEGAKLLGLKTDIVGIEFDEQAVTAAVSAGHTRVHQDIREAEVGLYSDVTGAILSSPCPTFSPAGLGTGRADMQILLDVITHSGQGCDCTWEEIAAELDAAADPRTALAAQVMRWVLQLPNLQWLALEQVAVPAVAYMFEDIAAELMSYDDGGGDFDPDDLEDGGGGGSGPGWESVDVFKVDAVNLGMAVRRERMFLVARRYDALGGRNAPSPAWLPADTFPPAPTLAQVLGWEPGHRMRTRGNLRGNGGNFFSCDGPSWCLTESARSWVREADGLRMTPAQAGLLQGFRAEYPWSGARTRQFHQAADVVLPPVAAAVLGYVTNTQWVEPVRAYLDDLYRPARAIATAPPAPAGPQQLDLLSLLDEPAVA